MNPQLHKILMELDYKFDIDIDEYFQLAAADRKILARMVVDYFKPSLNDNPLLIVQIRSAFEIKLNEYEELEKFELCDLYKRVLKELDKLRFPLNDDF